MAIHAFAEIRAPGGLQIVTRLPFHPFRLLGPRGPAAARVAPPQVEGLYFFDTDGKAAFDGVPPGAYRLELCGFNIHEKSVHDPRGGGEGEVPLTALLGRGHFVEVAIEPGKTTRKDLTTRHDAPFDACCGVGGV